MRSFAKSILSYFAAFSETRFRFSRKLPYEWSDDPFTLDLSISPEFQNNLLESVPGLERSDMVENALLCSSLKMK